MTLGTLFSCVILALKRKSSQISVEENKSAKEKVTDSDLAREGRITIPMYTKEVHEQWDEIIANLKKGDEVFGRTVIGVCVCNRILLDETLDRTYKGICSGSTACQWCENCGPKLDEDFDFKATSETGIGTCKECSAEIKTPQ